jgi:hypothetical protein
LHNLNTFIMQKIKSFFLFATALFPLLQGVAQTPFPPGTNVALAKPGMNNAPKNYTIYTSTAVSSSTFTPGVSFTPTYDINGIGLNPVDQFIYGASFVGNDNTVGNNMGVSLRRVGADGTVVDLGLLPTTGQTTIEFPNFSAGAVSTNGTYYYMTFGLKPSGAAKVAMTTALSVPLDLNADDLRLFLCWKDSISSLSANAGNNIAGGLSDYYELDFSDPDVTAALEAFLDDVNANYPDVYNADGGLQDFAISPIDSKIYGYISYPSGGATVGRPVVLAAPASNISTVTPVGTTINSVPGQEVAGVQFDMAGNLYGLFTTGDYAQINLSTGALSGLTLSNIATTGGNLRGDLASGATNIPFPVKLMTFTGYNNGTVNQLSWSTATEQNSKGFAIERSKDGEQWLTIGYVGSKAPGGCSSSKLDYTFNDPTAFPGDNYYRLKQTDADGRYTYSFTVRVQTHSEGSYDLYPNPAEDVVYIKGIRSQDVIRLTDLSGKVLQQSPAAGQLMQLDLTGYASGLYFVQVVADSHIQRTFKISKR